MKRQLFSVILFTMITFSGYSQIEKKTFLLGGYASLNSLSSFESLYINVNPNTGLFLTNKFCLGVSVPLLYVPEQFYWGVSPFARYYLKSGVPRSLFFSASIGLTSILETENTLSNNALTLGIGHVWLLNKSVGFETEFNGGTNFENIDFGLYFGFQIYFNRSNTKSE